VSECLNFWVRGFNFEFTMPIRSLHVFLSYCDSLLLFRVLLLLYHLNFPSGDNKGSLSLMYSRYIMNVCGLSECPQLFLKF